MGMIDNIRGSVKDRVEIVEHVKTLCKHIEDISEAQDEMSKALISIYNNQVAIAKSMKIKLPDPLIKMEVE